MAGDLAVSNQVVVLAVQGLHYSLCALTLHVYRVFTILFVRVCRVCAVLAVCSLSTVPAVFYHVMALR